MAALWSPKEQKLYSRSTSSQYHMLAAILSFVTFIMLWLWLAGATGFESAADTNSGGRTAMRLLSAACTSAQHIAGAACQVSTKYVSSDLEQAWLANAGKWEQDFCPNMAAHEAAVKAWVDTLRQHTSLQEQHNASDISPAQTLGAQQKMDPRIFSRFVTAYNCAGQQQLREQVTWIEPLSHGLRHPNALCGRGTDLMDRTYLLLAHKAEHDAAKQLGNIHCRDRACQAIYFDLGATALQQGPQEAGQGWFFDAYHRQGFDFDRFLLWEAVPNPQPANIFKHVPKANMHKYQYFNIPVMSDTSDPSNPVNMLKTIAQPGDFVVFKLDIDNYGVEHAILDALVKDPGALALVDEFFFEEHVNFKEMLPSWGNTVGANTSLATSYALFHSLRQKGLRAHSWV